MKIFLLLTLLTISVSGTPHDHSRLKEENANENFNPVKLRHTQRLSANESISNSNKDENIKIKHTNNDDDDDSIFLRVKSHMKNQNATSGEEVHFKCKIEGRPMENIQYTWYHNNRKIASSHRFRITLKPWGSKLQIRSLYTLDTGSYRCEASNGLRRVHTTAYLFVSFERPPISEINKKNPNIPKGTCEPYRGEVCKNYFGENYVFVDVFEYQPNMEEAMKIAIAATNSLSTRCQQLAIPAFCFYIFSTCHKEDNGDIMRGERLCREDCEALKSNICEIDQLSNAFMKNLSNAADCSFLSLQSESNCKQLNLITKFNHNKQTNDNDVLCYDNNGIDYSGSAHVTESGIECKSWPQHMIDENFELLNGHNFCRNPGGEMIKPWCFVDDERVKREECDLQLCGFGMKTNVLISLSISCISFVLFIVGFSLYCLRRKKIRKRQTLVDFTFKHGINKPLLPPQHHIPELNPSSIYFITEIGTGDYGNVYKATVTGNTRFKSKEAFAVKTLTKNFTPSQLEQFTKEMEEMAKLNHKNITTLQGIVMRSNLHWMIFDYTQQVDLHEYLLLNSPSSKYSKTSGPNTAGYFSSQIDNIDFMDMAVQIASGMEYLTNNNFIHRDLAARNILVCGNMELKISNLGVIRDSYLSSYYKDEQGSLMPIRWMAPESIYSWTFSDKSTVWSFGVLLWEMFSYGLQPYCGYSNQEVLEMISHGQLLNCPDQCPAKMYSLMQECWSSVSKSRPMFCEIGERLRSWMEAGEVMIVKNVYSNKSHDRYRSPSPPPEYRSHQSNPTSSWNESNPFSEGSLPYIHLNGPQYDTIKTGQRHQNYNESGDCLFQAQNNALQSLNRPSTTI